MEKVLTHSERLLLVEYDLDVWIENFLIAKKSENLANGSLRFYRFKLNAFSNYCDTKLIRTVTQIQTVDIRNYFTYLEIHHSSKGNVHAHFRAIKCFLRWFENEAEPENWKNPINKIHAPKVPEEILEPVELEVVSTLIKVCNTDSFLDVRDQAIFYTLLDTGVRAQELLDMNIEDISFSDGAIVILHGKGRKSRTVGIYTTTKHALKKYIKLRNDTDPHLWVTEDLEPISYDGLRAIVTRRSKEAGLEKSPSLHSFRRAFAISFLRSGGDSMTLSKLLGHTSMAVVSKYLKFLPRDLLMAHHRFSPVDQLKE